MHSPRSVPESTRSAWQFVPAGLALVVVSSVIESFERLNGRWVLFGKPIGALGAATMALVAAVIAIGLLFFVRLLWRQPAAGRWAVLVFLAAGLATSVGTFCGYVEEGGLRAWAFRPYVRGLLVSLGTMLIACGLPASMGRRTMLKVSAVATRAGSRRVSWALAFFGVMVSAIFAKAVLEGIPHTNDGPTYFLQGRLMMQGRLTCEPPLHPELFQWWRLKFSVTPAGFAGQYPPGWPLILGVFDRLGFRWLANPLLLGGIVLLLHRFVRRRLNTRVALYGTLAFVVSPFVVLSAAEQLSHIALAFFLLAFTVYLWEALEEASYLKATVAGAAMSAALACRPADAVFCSLAMAPVVLAAVVKSPARFLQLPAVVAGSLPGIAAFFWANAVVTGNASRTMYDPKRSGVAMLLSQTPDGLVAAVSWIHENVVGLGLYGYLGAAPVIALVCYSLVFCRREVGRVLPLVAWGIGTILGYSLFVFMENPYFGPRWLLPAMLILAVMIGIVAQSAVRRSRPGRAHAELYGILANWLVVALVALVVVILPLRAVELITSPPNRVDGRVWRVVQAKGIHNAVVALPRDDNRRIPGFLKDPRAGFWTMTLPFELNDVIFVTVSPKWRELARESFPNRRLYQMSSDPLDYEVYPADELEPDKPD